MMDNAESQGNRPKISQLAVFSIITPIALLIIGYTAIGPAVILSAPVGIGLGVAALISIKKSKGKLKGIGFAISGIIISFIIIAWFIYVFFLFMSYFREKPYSDTNPEAIIKKVENYSGLEFPEKKESLRAAEKITGGIDHEYTFIARFTTDQNSFAELRNSLSKTESYLEEITDELLTEDGNRYTYGSRARVRVGSMWQKNAPEWFNAEIPKGKVYELELLPSSKMMFHFICVELPDSNDVVVHIEGWGGDKELRDTLSKPQKVEELK